MTNSWQKSKTAPKNGTEILGYWTKTQSYDLTSYGKGGWWDSQGFKTGAPSFWQPLPEPPEAA